jgi:hypothetical protein
MLWLEDGETGLFGTTPPLARAPQSVNSTARLIDLLASSFVE